MTNENQLPAIYGMDQSKAISVLQESLYPGAKADSVALVMEYCRAAGLDPMQKPVHIVPMWDKNLRAMRDVIMPGVNSYRVNAMRSRDYLGISEPEFGPMVEGGAVGISYPEWCKVTVKRSINGQIAEFTVVEYWIENYATAGKDSSMPNAMWKKRPRGQIAKCAEAQALRKAFPEIASAPTYEEMEGKIDQSEDKPVMKHMGNVEVVTNKAPTEEEVKEAIESLEQCIDKGVEALGNQWKSLSIDLRKAIGAEEIATMKKAAEDHMKPLSKKMADAKTLDELYELADVERELNEDERAAFEKRLDELETKI